MPKLTFQWNSVPKLILGAEVHRLMPKLFRAEVTRAEYRLAPILGEKNMIFPRSVENSLYIIAYNNLWATSNFEPNHVINTPFQGPLNYFKTTKVNKIYPN